MHEKTKQFLDLGNRQHRTGILKTGHKHRVSSRILPPYYLKEIFRLQCREGKPKKSLVVCLCSHRDQSFKRPKKQESAGQNTGEKEASPKESFGNEQRGLLKSWAE